MTFSLLSLQGPERFRWRWINAVLECPWHSGSSSPVGARRVDALAPPAAIKVQRLGWECWGKKVKTWPCCQSLSLCLLFFFSCLTASSLQRSQCHEKSQWSVMPFQFNEMDIKNWSLSSTKITIWNVYQNDVFVWSLLRCWNVNNGLGPCIHEIPFAGIPSPQDAKEASARTRFPRKVWVFWRLSWHGCSWW